MRASVSTLLLPDVSFLSVSCFSLCVCESQSAEANATDSSSTLFYSSSLPTQYLPSLALSTPRVCQVPPTPLLPTSPLRHSSGLQSSQSPYQNKHMRGEYLCVSVSMCSGVWALMGCMCGGG